MSGNNIDGGNVSVDTTVGGTKIVSGRTLRKGLVIQNLGAGTLYLGATGVTTSTGLKVPANSSIEVGDFVGATLFGISDAGTLDVRWLGVF